MLLRKFSHLLIRVNFDFNSNVYVFLDNWLNNCDLNLVGQGEGRVKEDLDRATAEDLKLHKLDLKIAEKQVFGHQLGPNEWDRLNDRDKKIKSEQMLAIVKQRMAKRFNENNK